MTTTIQSPKKQLSLQEFLQLAETDPASEWIDRTIVQKPVPQIQHSLLQGKLLAAINERGIPLQLLYAFPELRCVLVDRVIVPDITVLKWDRVPTNDVGEVQGELETCPDWMIEILSPEQSATRTIKNILYCVEQGTELGWLIDPNERQVFSFHPQQPTQVHEGDDSLPMLSVLSNWQLTVADLFGWLSFKKGSGV